MKTPDTVMGPVKTRGDFRKLSESKRTGADRTQEYPELPENHPLCELWDTMTEFYGRAWTGPYGVRPTWTWLDALKNLSVADYGQGIAALKTRNKPFPPNPGEFLALIETPAQKRNRIGSENVKALPPPRTHPGKAYFDELRGEGAHG